MTTLVLYSEVFELRVPGWIKILLPYSQLSNMSRRSFICAFGLRLERSIDLHGELRRTELCVKLQ